MRIAGVDEVGRGCLAGAVVVAAVILRPGAEMPGLADSKQLTPARRLALVPRIHRHAEAWALGRAEPAEVDQLNVLQATLLAMQRAVASLPVPPDQVLVDGNRVPRLAMPVMAVVGGDASVPVIAAASVLAKVWRDQEMQLLDRLAPAYGFADHKGYPTAAHRDALRRYGVTAWHRRSYAPVRALLACAALPSNI